MPPAPRRSMISYAPMRAPEARASSTWRQPTTPCRRRSKCLSWTEPVHFLQIWIVPDRRGLAPAYGQHPVDRETAGRGFALLASKDGREGSLQVHQDVDLWLALVDKGGPRELRLREGRHAWVHVARGAVRVNASELAEGDGAAISGAQAVTLSEGDAAEVLVFDLG